MNALDRSYRACKATEKFRKMRAYLPGRRKLCHWHHVAEFDKLPNIRRHEAADWFTVAPCDCELCKKGKPAPGRPGW